MSLGGPHMAYTKHYNLYRLRTCFNPPILEGSYDGMSWILVSALSMKSLPPTDIFKTRAGDYVCKRCGDCIPSEPELHEGRCTK